MNMDIDVIIFIVIVVITIGLVARDEYNERKNKRD